MRFCGACGARLRESLAPRGVNGEADQAQRRHMTVMFCDVVDSTSLAEALDPEDFREVLTSFQAACASAIERFNGHVAQWVGDGVLAYFGYPRAHEDDARRAVHAALGILEEIAALNKRVNELFEVSLRVRVGLHSGVVVAGEMGAGQTREPLAIVGETPHIAARLQTLAQPGSVLMTDATLQLVSDHFETEALGASPLKGISRPIAVHRVVRPVGEVPELKALGARPFTPLVNRTSALARLTEAWGQARRAEGVIVYIAGEAGIGKSRLVRALREEVGAEAAAEHVLLCSPHHSSTALYPASRFLERLLGLDSTQAPEHQLEAIERSVVGAGLDPREAVALLAQLLSIPVSGEGTRAMMPRDARNATLHILERLLVGDAARHPLLFVVEDLHWADPTTIELLERCVANLSSIPVACVFTFRTEFEPPWTHSAAGVEINLGPLESGDVREMAAAASPKTLDADALTQVESAADGVPLFVEEMVKVLAAGPAPDAPARGTPQSAVPATLQGLLAERLDRLPQLGDVIDVAAVLGREFERELLQALSPSGSAEFRSALAQLAAEDVLRPVEGSRSRLEFKHALLQEAAYERLLRPRRRALHGRVAELLVARPAPAWESDPERIGYHWSCAGQPAKAMAYWELAGKRALKSAAFPEAAEHFRSALEALDAARPRPDADLERGDLLTDIGAALQAGRTPTADVDLTYAEARSAYERVGRRERLIPVIRGQWLFHLVRAEYEAALAAGEEMLAMGERGGQPMCLAEGHLYRGLAHMYMGGLDRARAELEEAHRLHVRPELPDHIYEAQGDAGVAALAYVALVLFNQGYVQESNERSEESLELAEEVGGPVTLAQTWGMRAGLLLTRGELVRLGPWLEMVRTHCVERNIGYWRTVSSLWSAWLQGRAGDPKLGIARLQEQLVAYFASGGRLGVPHFYILLADLRAAAGDRQRALGALSAGEEHIEATGERMSESELHLFRGRVLMSGEQPDPSGATAAYERAADVAKAQDAKLLELRAATFLASHQRQIGEAGTALARVESLCRWFGPEAQTPDVVRARALVGDVATLR
jgi:class 3 adenylate cyclase/tetratricopeptide (TPR) repeat protein